MKFATLVVDGRRIVAQIDPVAGTYWPLETEIGRPVEDMPALIANFEVLGSRAASRGLGRPLAGARFAAPLVPPRNLMCVGKNYHAHAEEFTRSGFDSSAKSAAEAIPTAPIIFTKAPQTVIATGDAIAYPHGVSSSVDYEAELGVVIGRGGRRIARHEAYDHVFGYVILNDVTARDLQGRHKQWFLGKSLDTFCPMGPWITTAEELDPEALQLHCWVNGELRQSANTCDLIFDVPTLIETLSASLSLMPGDVIATGTPAGVGIGFDPPRYLSPGDEVAIEITGLGRLVNVVASI